MRIDLGHLAAWSHQPKGNPKAQLLLIHGISEHSARHLNTVNYLLSQNIGVTRFDLRGMGESGGRRQWVEKFHDYVEDTNTIYNWMLRNVAPQPFFVLGHSLGGAIALRFAALRSQEFKGLILTAPAYLVGGIHSPLKIRVGRFLNKFSSTVRIPKTGDPWEISRDPEVVRAFKEDPLCPSYNTVGQGVAILDTLPDTLEVCKRIRCPVLIVHGSHDPLIRVEGSFALFQALRVSKELVILPGGYHEPHNDLDKEVFFAHLGQWISGFLSVPALAREPVAQKAAPVDRT